MGVYNSSVRQVSILNVADYLQVLECPLPKPSDERYVEARLLEALVEAKLALGFWREAFGERPSPWGVSKFCESLRNGLDYVFH